MLSSRPLCMKYPSPLAGPAKALRAAALLLFLALAHTLRAQPVTIVFTHVGNPGNAADGTSFGSVGYSFDIGAYFITESQYAVFLNSVATIGDPYGLYAANGYNSDNKTGIIRSGSGTASIPYSYSVAGTSGSDPMTFTSWLDAARFCNWLHNSQPGTGVEDATTTEEGAYTLDGDTQSGSETRNPYATYWIPSEDEWYKAAYYDPTLQSGTGGYWTYATRSNTAPGNTIGSGSNEANYFNGKYCVTSSTTTVGGTNVDFLTPVGSFPNSHSYYGTFDQSGDIYEWTDGLTFPNNNGTPQRHARGGAWFADAAAMQSSASVLYAAPATQASVGFRVASNRGPTLSATAVGQFTLILTSTDTSGAVPRAPGYATLFTTSKGGAILAGKLPDGESLTVSGTLLTGSNSSSFSISKALSYASATPATAMGSIVGSIIFQQSTGSDVFGALAWSKPRQTRGPYPAAINTVLNITGALFTPPTTGASVLPGFTTGTLVLTDTSGLSISNTVSLSSSNVLTITGTNVAATRAAISAANGILSGAFTYPGQKKPTSFQGVILQDAKTGQGLFIGPNGSGSVLVH